MTRQRKLAWAAVLCGIALTLWLAWFAIIRGACTWYGYRTDRTTKYATFIGCMVHTPSGWAPRSELRTGQ